MEGRHVEEDAPMFSEHVGQRFEVRPYRRHTSGYVAQWFKVVDTQTKETVRTGIEDERAAQDYADTLNKTTK